MFPLTPCNRRKAASWGGKVRPRLTTTPAPANPQRRLDLGDQRERIGADDVQSRVGEQPRYDRQRSQPVRDAHPKPSSYPRRAAPQESGPHLPNPTPLGERQSVTRCACRDRIPRPATVRESCPGLSGRFRVSRPRTSGSLERVRVFMLMIAWSIDFRVQRL